MKEALAASAAELRALLVEKLGVLTAAEFARAESLSERSRLPLDQILVQRCRIPASFLLANLADSWGVGYTDLDPADVDPGALDLLSAEFARRNGYYRGQPLTYPRGGE